MELNEIVTHLVTFIFGGAAGSFLTIKIRSDSNTTRQENINVTKGDVVGRDKK